MAEKTLEKVMHKKVKPIVDEAMHKFLGITIEELSKDITDRIESKPLFVYDIDVTLPFKAAKQLFKKNFFTKLIKTHYGNVSEVAKLTGLDRRSIHRIVEQLHINVDKCRKEMELPSALKKEAVDSILKNTFDEYKQVIHPTKLEQMYKNVATLSEDITKELPPLTIKWKDAEQNFEREYLQRALSNNHYDITTTAKKIKLRYETLIRKMKKLGIGKK